MYIIALLNLKIADVVASELQFYFLYYQSISLNFIGYFQPPAFDFFPPNTCLQSLDMHF